MPQTVSQLAAAALALLSLVVLTPTDNVCHGAVLPAIDADDFGFYTDSGNHNPSNDIYVARANFGDNLRNFFTFDLSGLVIPVGDQIVAATFRVETLPNNPPLPNSLTTYTIWDVTTSRTDLEGGGAGLTAIYDDLGSGIEYGFLTFNGPLFPPAVDSDILNVPFNSDGIAAITAAAGGNYFAIGGALTNASDNAELFSMTNGNAAGRVHELIIETAAIPEPSSFALMAGCVLGLAARRRLRKAVRKESSAT